MSLEERSVAQGLHSSQRTILEGLSRGRSTIKLMEDVCHTAEEHLGPATRCVLMLHRDGYLYRGAAPSMPEAYLEAVDGLKIEGELAFDYEPEAPHVYSDVFTDPRTEPARPICAHFGIEAAWTFPVIDRRDESNVGIIVVYRPKDSVPTPEENEYLARLSDLSALITRRYMLERDVTLEQARFAHVLDSTNTGIFEWNPKTGATWLSKRGREVLGFSGSDDDAIGDDWFWEAIHPDDLPATTRAVHDHFASGEGFFHAEFRVRTPAGEWRWIQDRGRTVRRDARGNPTLVLGTMQDITEAKRIEQRLQRLQRLESLGEIANGIAHDFNNLLAGVRGGLELALLDVPDDHPAAEDLQLALHAASRGSELTRRLMALASEPVGRIGAVSLPELVEQTVRFELMESSMHTNFAIAPDLRDVWANEVELRQVISNITRNAAEADAGVLDISLENESEPDVPDLEPACYVRLRFRDDGPGIPVETLPRVFDPYFSTKSQGSGLGLSAAYAMVKRLGGAMTAESVAGEGATFTVFLPCHESPDIE